MFATLELMLPWDHDWTAAEAVSRLGNCPFNPWRRCSNWIWLYGIIYVACGLKSRRVIQDEEEDDESPGGGDAMNKTVCITISSVYVISVPLFVPSPIVARSTVLLFTGLYHPSYYYIIASRLQMEWISAYNYKYFRPYTLVNSVCQNDQFSTLSRSRKWLKINLYYWL